ncbi:hypothetical protein ABIB62_002355 [Mucilaginibacter sp. UYP25]|uniref:hypothetical protein n=1 Tax=unclassified Mucilaginibacter TaxID=2617802 RepID=UPI0033952956
MEGNSLLIQVSAFSGLIGALLTQGLTGLFSYVGDKRKANTELKSTFRNKQVDIAENFYFVTGEKMAIVKKNIGYWQNYNNSRSEKSLDFLNQEMTKLNAYMNRLDAENWKYNLAGLYFDVSFTNESIIASNSKSKEMYLKVLDITDQIKHSLPNEQSDLYRLQSEYISEMLKHYEEIYHHMANDMTVVKAELLKKFNHKGF